MRNVRLEHNATMMSIWVGILMMSKRINVPCIHPDYLKQLVMYLWTLHMIWTKNFWFGYNA